MSTNEKSLWILVGGNGSGKSSFYNAFLKPTGLYFVNADIIAKAKFPSGKDEDAWQAQQEARKTCEELIEKGETFCFETVFSHHSKIELIVKAKSQGYTINLIYIHLESTELHKARVIQRVSEGGHDVPHDRIESRIPRLQRNVQFALTLADNAKILDNSKGANEAFKQIVTIKDKSIVDSINPLPEWAKELLSDFNP